MVYKLALELVQDGIPNLKFSNPNNYMYISSNDYKNSKIINEKYKIRDYEIYMEKNKYKFNLDEVYFCFQNYGEPYIEKSKISLMMFKKINDDLYIEILEEEDLEFSKITKEVLNHQEMKKLYDKEEDDIKYKIYFNSLYPYDFIDIEKKNLDLSVVYYYDDEHVEIHLLDVYCLGYDKYEVIRKKCLVKKSDFALVNGHMPNNEVIYQEHEEDDNKEKITTEEKTKSLIRRIFNFPNE